MNNNCKHRRIRKYFAFGKKSAPRRYCKDCDKIITGKDLQEMKKNNKRERR